MSHQTLIFSLPIEWTKLKTHLLSEVWPVVHRVSCNMKYIFNHVKSSCNYSQILRLYRILFLGIFNNTLNREDREKRKISAPPTMETPDRRTSFIKNVPASHNLKGNLHDNPSYTIPGQNDNEFHPGFPSVITEQIEPSIGNS